MSRPPAKQYGSKPMSKAYNKVRAFIAETYRNETPLTDDERDELIRKAGGR